MERNLEVKRLYSLGDFKNIEFRNSLVNIPEHLANNDKVVSLLYFQQVLSCEIAYRKYYELINKISKDKIEDVLKVLEEEREQTLVELMQEIEKADAEKIVNDYGKKEK